MTWTRQQDSLGLRGDVDVGGCTRETSISAWLQLDLQDNNDGLQAPPSPRLPAESQRQQPHELSLHLESK